MVASVPLDHQDVVVAGEGEQVTFSVGVAESTGGGIDASGDPPSLDSGTVSVRLFGHSRKGGIRDPRNCAVWFGDAWLELESGEADTVDTPERAVPKGGGIRTFTIRYGRSLVRYGTYFGKGTTRIEHSIVDERMGNRPMMGQGPGMRHPGSRLAIRMAEAGASKSTAGRQSAARPEHRSSVTAMSDWPSR